LSNSIKHSLTKYIYFKIPETPYYLPTEGPEPSGVKTWAQIAELTPAQQQQQQDKSWAFVVNPNAMSEMSIADAESQLCPFFVMGECRYNENW
jgi:hypothetical protein